MGTKSGKLVGVMPVRNEAWVLGLSARVALKWCDELVILLHACTDTSFEIAMQVANEYDRRVVVVGDDNPVWDEMRHRQHMLNLARALHAEAIAIIDADEVLTANLCNTAWGQAANMPRGFILQYPGYNLRGANSLHYYHGDGIWGKRWFSIAFRDELCLSWSGDKFHSREPGGRPLHALQPVAQGDGGVFHLWGASERRLVAKHALYKMTERLRWPEKRVQDIDAMYSWAIKGDPTQVAWGTPGTWKYKPVPASWWDGHRDLLKYLDVDAEPWQEAECVALMKEHGPRVFQGLDLFGVV